MKEQKKRQVKEHDQRRNTETELIGEELCEYLKSFRFRRKLFGVDEKELWIIVSNICNYYGHRESESRVRIQTLESLLYETGQRAAKLELYAEMLKRSHDA